MLPSLKKAGGAFFFCVFPAISDCPFLISPTGNSGWVAGREPPGHRLAFAACLGLIEGRKPAVLSLKETLNALGSSGRRKISLCSIDRSTRTPKMTEEPVVFFHEQCTAQGLAPQCARRHSSAPEVSSKHLQCGFICVRFVLYMFFSWWGVGSWLSRQSAEHWDRSKFFLQTHW